MYNVYFSSSSKPSSTRTRVLLSFWFPLRAAIQVEGERGADLPPHIHAVGGQEALLHDTDILGWVTEGY